MASLGWERRWRTRRTWAMGIGASVVRMAMCGPAMVLPRNMLSCSIFVIHLIKMVVILHWEVLSPRKRIWGEAGGGSASNMVMCGARTVQVSVL